MSFRRFVNLVSRDSMKCVYTLRRIDISGLFLPTTTTITNNNGGDMLPAAACCLPDPFVNFSASHHRNDSGEMSFHLLDNKLIATDTTTGGTFLYDHDKDSVRPLPTHERLKPYVVSHTVGNTLYVIDRLTNGSGTRSFQELVYEPSLHGRWHWHVHPPPPPPPGVQDAADDPTRIDSFAAEGSKIWVSARGSGDVKGCTHLFDAETMTWSKEPAEWVLPFRGCAEYVPELNKLWFGMSSTTKEEHHHHGCSFLCASDLSRASISKLPALLAVLEDTAARAPDGLEFVTASAIYLGSDKFCVARFFATPMQDLDKDEHFVVMTGVEVVTTTSSSSDGGKKVLTMVERNAERYVLNVDDLYRVL